MHAAARVRAPREVVDQLLARELQVLLGGGGPAGGARVARIQIDLGDGTTLRQDVEVELGRPDRSGDEVTVWPLSWRPLGHHAILPDLEAHLEVRSARWDTELDLVGSYRPPLGPVGALGDYLIAERMSLGVSDFLADLARALDVHSGDVARSAHHRAVPAGRLEVPGRAAREPGADAT